jgi:uncharacterized protein YecE (DUF72 family)
MTELRIGTSGWTYQGWKDQFYPKGVGAKRMLAYYATRFDTTEINGTFYRLPTDKAVKSWRDGTPDDFRFAWKISRFVTHNKKLKDAGSSIELIFGRMAPLKAKSGPVLIQLPPFLKRDDERLTGFLKLLPKDWRHAVEFRHDSWYAPAVFEMLEKAKVALCISDHEDAPSPFEVTTDFVYLRGHGPKGNYRDSYPDATLKRWAKHIRGWRKDGRDVWCYFDNDIKAEAPRDADRLIAMLS